MLIVQNLSYVHPNKDVLFDHLHFIVHKYDKIALIGNNGVGKSTLLQLLAGVLQPTGGTVHAETPSYYLPQHFGQWNGCTIAEALRIGDKLKAFAQILEGKMTEANLSLLNDDWTIEERCQQALAHWELDDLDLVQPMRELSGGQKTKIFLAGISIHRPDIVLMDEPSNHLDVQSRQLLYDFIQTTSSTLVVVSHDRKLLNLLDSVYELSHQGVTVYGGNYDFYAEQKIVERNALNQDIHSKEKALRKAKERERETIERQQKLDARGKKKQEKAGLPTISMKTFQNNAEKSTARIKDVHSEKIGTISSEISQLRKELPDIDKMKFGFGNSALHRGKVLVSAHNIHFGYGKDMLWREPLNLHITSGERIAIKGKNGSGKTTLIKIILGQIVPQTGTIQRANAKTVYIDQEYSLIDNLLTVYEQAQRFHATVLQEHEIKIRLNRFLFPKETWNKPCQALSGGEKMRLMLCCLTISHQAPDFLLLDEPTNNLDIQNLEIMTAALNGYQGTLLVISHDDYFLEQVQVTRAINLGQ